MADDGNLSTVLRALDQVKRQIIADAEKALDKSAAEVVSAMKAVAPVAEVDGGQLRDSVRVVTADSAESLKREIVAGDAEADYARFNEFNANGSPFFWPVWRLLKRRTVARVNRSPNAAIRKFNND